MHVTTPLYRMTERMVGGDLAGLLTSLRATGESWEGIARRLHADHGVEVTTQTLRVWGRSLAIGDHDQAATA